MTQTRECERCQRFKKLEEFGNASTIYCRACVMVLRESAPDAPKSTSPPRILYDSDCPICRKLARIVGARAKGTMVVEPWQSFRISTSARRIFPNDVLDRPADELRVWTGAKLLEGEAAWEFVLERHSDLRYLHKAASTIGMQQVTARILRASGHLARAARGCCGGTRRRRRS